jgi:hypothetical protein
MTTPTADADATPAAGRPASQATPGARPGSERRLPAVAFADQVGAALASSQPADQR